MTPQKLAAIKALADDPRGEPNTRAAAQRKLAEIAAENPPDLRNSHKLHPGLHLEPGYQRYRFFNFDCWTKTDKGNWTTKAGIYRITLFKRKSGLWAWGKFHIQILGNSHGTFSRGDFKSISEARDDAWNHLQTL